MGDLSGDISINDKNDNEVLVDSEDLLKFVVINYIKNNLIEKIEQMNYKELIDFVGITHKYE